MITILSQITQEDSCQLPQLFEEERQRLQIMMAQRPKIEQPVQEDVPLPVLPIRCIPTLEEQIEAFMEEMPGLRRAPEGKIPSQVLYALYCNWCKTHQLPSVSSRSFCLHLVSNAQRYKIKHTNFLWQGKHLRGFRGIMFVNTDNQIKKFSKEV